MQTASSLVPITVTAHTFSLYFYATNRCPIYFSHISLLLYNVLPMYLPKVSLTPLYSERVVLLEFVLLFLLSISSMILQEAQKYPFVSDKMIHPLL